MTVLYALHKPAEDHLRHVTKYMMTHGPPVLFAYWRRNAWWALEGSHRIAAAHKLKLTPVLKATTLSMLIEHDTSNVWPDKRVSTLLEFYDKVNWWVRYVFHDLPTVKMTDRTTDDLRDAYKRRYMIHVCKDGTVTYRDTVTKEKVFNGRALPVFSVDTIEEAKAIQSRFCRLQYSNHPLMPNKPWYKLNEFSGELEDLDRVRAMFAKYYKEHKEREATVKLVSKAVRTRRPRKAKKTCA